jgi:acyl-CoA synthetase (AMP-forming)/AMP-acid ligase II
LSHRGITNNARFCAEILQAGAGDVWVNPMPLFHTAGCVLFTLGPVHGQFTQVLVPGFEPGLVLHLIESERATTFAGAPTMLLAQLDHTDFRGRDLSRVRTAFVGGATVPPALARRIESEVGVPLSIQYGQTEASPCITQTRPEDSPADRAETLGGWCRTGLDDWPVQRRAVDLSCEGRWPGARSVERCLACSCDGSSRYGRGLSGVDAAQIATAHPVAVAPTRSVARRARLTALAKNRKSASTRSVPRTRARRPPCLRRIRCPSLRSTFGRVAR